MKDVRSIHINHSQRKICFFSIIVKALNMIVSEAVLEIHAQPNEETLKKVRKSRGTLMTVILFPQYM